MTPTSLQRLGALGQSVWIDFIERRMLNNGELALMIGNDGVTGVTTNPTIFDKALAADGDYAADRARLAAAGHDPAAIVDALMRQDVMQAADILHPVYERTDGADGYVSLEISPRLAYDTAATVAEAEYVWGVLARPNVMIKVPATREGVAAIRALTAAGVNVNATLLFSVARYREVAEAYRQGLEASAAAGRPLAHVASVASFFVSRIDTLIDQRLAAHRDDGAITLRGQAATACARLAYREFQRLQSETPWQQIAARGARPQRLLWASTSTKDPSYSDVRYVEALIGPHTVNTLTLDTLAAYRHHGDPAVRIDLEVAQAELLIARLATFRIDMDRIAAELEAEGVRRFAASEAALRDRVARALVPH
jgi:transaldolase